MQSFHKALAILIILATWGCASTSSVLITSDPKGADVVVNNKKQGETPLTLDMSNFASKYGDIVGGDYTFRVEKKGYAAKSRSYRILPFTMISDVIPSHLHFTLKRESDSIETASLPQKNITESKQENRFGSDENKGARGPDYSSLSSKRWAVIIGISEYKDSRIPSLRYASADAKAFYNWIISPKGGQFSPSRVKLLLDKDSTTNEIKDALFVWLKQALEEDIVTLYFAGHGSPESPDSPNNLFLLTYDTKFDYIAATGFPMWDIETALKRFIRAKKVIVIADACHSGGIGDEFNVARRAARGIGVNPISSGLQTLTQIGDGIAVISASDNKQFSQEGKQWGGGHGVFTYFLLKGLAGDADYSKDNRVTLGELIPYVSEQVRRATNNAQSPNISGKFDPALSIAK